VSGKRRKAKFDVYRDGKIHVCKRQCETCIFRDGGMHLNPGRLEQLVSEAVKNESTIVCHDTLDGPNAACAGFFHRHKTAPLQIAERLGLIEFVEP